jgi:hypothetical protein
LKTLRSVNFLYTLYEDDDGAYVIDLVVPSPVNSWATYEKRVVLNAYDKILLKLFPERADKLASNLISEEKHRQKY